jgi:hypothetical protein
MKAPVDMTRYPNLTQRNGIYYFRRVIPKDLRETYGKREELISLKTRDLAEARRAYHRVALEVDQRIEEHRAHLRWQQSEQLQDLTPAQLALVKAAYFAYILEEDEETRLEGFAEDVDPDGDVPFAPRPSWGGEDAPVRR